ncbi:MAG: (d)CMP kinase [candidate division KSB1 bacterium]|nr:(d)CMP kinase [candidate division KSB1 bacterium]MDZ7301006.1 (d)CMP kinase [candidate division KSB1 bacterium]MDZ7310315.1 (d)CMP kinase [candidate division KSB1 bacterium]
MKDTPLKERRLIIAIDGPAGSGKSTTARLLAKRLGYTYLDTGAFYRALTLKALDEGVLPEDTAAIVKLAEKIKIELQPEEDKNRVLLDGCDVTKAIRAPRVTEAIAPISENPAVREIMVEKQRAFGRNGGVVVEGRDIGTVVFPDADLKIFMQASLEERARRRQEELAVMGIVRDLETLKKEIARRDHNDSRRKVAPLSRAADAIVLDTTSLTIEQQVEFIVQALKKKS